MCANKDVPPTTMALTIDELRWLYLSSALDSLAHSSGRSSPNDRQRRLSQSLAAALKTNENSKMLDLGAPFHLRSASAPVTMPKSSYHASPQGPTFLTRSRPSTSHGTTTSNCQEWIYRRPNKSAVFFRGSSHMSISTRHRRHFEGEEHLPSETAGNSDQDAVSFWSTILRPRSRLERSTSLLKAKPSRAQLVISRPIMPLPTISSSPAFMSEKLGPSLTRTPSITSTASTASSTSRPTTPTAGRRHRQMKPYPLCNRPYQNRHVKSPLDYSSLSCPPCKSILTRSSSMSTSISHTTSTTSPSSPSKSVKFVETPIVHYAWDLESLDEAASLSLPDIHMGIDIGSMDLGSNDEAQTCRRTSPNPEKERDGDKGVIRLRSLDRRASLPTKREKPSHSRRPTISGPYALGKFHTYADDTECSALSDDSPSQRAKGHQLPSSASLHINRLRNAPSMESVKSTRSLSGRSIRSLGSINSIRSLRAWLGKMRFRTNTKMNLGGGWSVP